MTSDAARGSRAGTKVRGSAGEPRAATAPRRTSKPKATAPPASKLVGILESQRRLGDASYPPTITRLADLSGDPLAQVKKALGGKDAKALVRLSHIGAAAKAALVLLAEDVELVARSDRLLLAQIHAARTTAERALGPAQLRKGLTKELGGAFAAALARRVEERRLPRGVGALPGKKPLFFLVEDAVLPAADAPPHVTPPAAGPIAGSFGERFDVAFTALDRAGGGHNYVTLGALRASLADVPRAVFDAELSTLRRQRRYTLDPSDGRHQQMTQAERDAGIMEAGNLLVYVARRSDA